MAKFTDKISGLINKQVPEFVLEQHPKFLEFVKSYYTFMESAELTVKSVQTTDGIQLETETAQDNELVLDGSRIDTDRTQLDAGDKILLESTTYGKFTRGETITGQTSNATATVLGEDLANNRLFISAQDKFVNGEAIVGASSAARAEISNYKPNPVTNIQELLNFRDPDKAISNFLTKFRNEFLNTIPENLISGVDKRKLIKNIKSVYQAKGTNRGHEIFFRLLFGLTSETIYPREQMLRVSDGKWDTKKVLRAIASVGDTANLIGRTIEGETSEATAIVENVFKFQIGADEVTEFILNEDSIVGTFSTSETIRGTETDTDDTYIKAVITGIPANPTLTNDGSLYTSGDTVTVTGGGEAAIVQVDAVGRSGIDEIIVASGGSGYTIGDDISFTNTDTGGGSASAKVSVVNGGFTLEESESTVNDHIVLEDETVRGDPYTGDKIVQESGSGSGDITDIRMINNGNNYLSLPAVTVTSSGGSNAEVFAYGDNIGRIQSLKIVSPGKGYEASPSPPSLSFPSYLVVSNASGTFVANETVTGEDSASSQVTGVVSTYDSDTGVLKVTSPSGEFGDVTSLTADSGVTATVRRNNLGTATITVASTVDTAGVYINQDGHASESAMKIQDSLYYQDFSYVIKVGRTIADWRDSFKKTMHTSGFYFQGQVNIESQVSVELQNITGINTGEDFEQIASIVNTLFTTIFGRRLGTTTDGTTLRANPELGVDPDFTDSTLSMLDITTRDLTLNQAMTLKFRSGFKNITIRDIENQYGYAYCGPTMNTINRFAFTAFSGSGGRAQTSNIGGELDSTITTAVSPMQLLNWADFRLTGTINTSLDGEIVQFRDITTDRLKTNLAIPTEIVES